MKLKSIKLAGFKSFMNPIIIPVSDKLTGIVGPNGCGKSNVIDAVRWVLGESAAKQLRGGTISDVIFNGTDKYKPQGQASVELIFDNTGSRITGDYSKYSEISVKRIITMDGQSSYYLNGTSCRRKDISDLFLGTGLGPRSYSIIEQGFISKLIEAKPEEFRLYLEEAAGISKFRERKKETQSRIQRTQENLNRLNDIREELGGNLEKLEKQSLEAQDYIRLNKESESLENKIYSYKWNKNSRSIATYKDEITKIEEQVSKFENDINALQQEKSTIKINLEKKETSLTVSKDDFYKVSAEITAKEQQVESKNMLKNQLLKDLDSVNKELLNINNNSSMDEDKIKKINSEIDLSKPKMIETQEDVVNKSTYLKKQISENSIIESDLLELKSKKVSIESNININKAKHEMYILRHEELSNKYSSQSNEISKIDTEELRNEKNKLIIKIDNTKSEVNNLSSNLSKIKSDILEVNQNINVENKNIDDLKETISGSKIILAKYEAQQEPKNISSQNNINILSKLQKLRSILKIENGWEQTIETVLGSMVHSFCLDEFPDMSNNIYTLDGKVNLLINSKIMDVSDVNPNSIASKIKNISISLYELLKDIHISISLQDSFNKISKSSDNISYITKDSCWISKNFIKINKPSNNEDSILLRQKKIDDLMTEVENNKIQLQNRIDDLTNYKKKLVSLKSDRNACNENIILMNRDLSSMNVKLNVASDNIEKAELRKKQIISENEKIKCDINNIEGNITNISKDISSLNNEILKIDKEINNKISNVQINASNIKDSQNKLLEVENKLNEFKNHINSLEMEKKSITIGIERIEERTTLLQDREKELKSEIYQIKIHDQDISHIDTLKINKSNIIDNNKLIEEEINKIKSTYEITVSKIDSYTESNYKAMQKLHKSQVQYESLVAKNNMIVEQSNISIADITEIHSKMEQEFSINSANDRLKEIENTINSFGPINLAAVNEFSSEKARLDDLNFQADDLTESLNSLLKIISKIEQETKVKFKDTFEQVNNYFMDFFPKIFGGGHGALKLTSDDMLDAGVQVIAKPPGKKVSRIQVLSGGEKSLVSIALVLSIFKINPAPFCLLDEVDAPLDDANVERFVNLISYMSEFSQFICITHNKVTMEKTDQLIGVTMNEPGISRVVSVDLEQALEYAED